MFINIYEHQQFFLLLEIDRKTRSYPEIFRIIEQNLSTLQNLKSFIS